MLLLLILMAAGWLCWWLSSHCRSCDSCHGIGFAFFAIFRVDSGVLGLVSGLPISPAVLSILQQDEKQSRRAGITVSLSAPILFSLGGCSPPVLLLLLPGVGKPESPCPTHTHKIDKNVEAPQAV